MLPFRRSLRCALTGGGAAAWTPASIAGLQLWLDASQIAGLNDGDAVATWSDLSGNGYNATQGTASARPLYKTNIINGLPAVLGDGVDDYLAATQANTGTTVTCFMVAKRSSYILTAALTLATPTGAGFDSVERCMAFYDSAATDTKSWRNFGGLSTITHPGNGVAYAAATRFDGTDNTAFLDGAASAAVATSGAWNYDRAYLFTFWNGGTCWNGYIGECIIYNAALTDVQVGQVFAYLRAKWGTP